MCQSRILKTGNRVGDAAEMCIIELVDFNENMLAAKEETAAKSTRRRRAPKKKTEAKAEAKSNSQEPDSEQPASEGETKE